MSVTSHLHPTPRITEKKVTVEEASEEMTQGYGASLQAQCKTQLISWIVYALEQLFGQIPQKSNKSINTH